MTRDRVSRDWGKALAKDNQCNDHPKPARALVKALAEHAHMSEPNARNVIDRLRHLTHCLGEQETMTLFRLQPGSKQVPKPPPPEDE